MVYIKFEQIAHRTGNLMNARVAELEHFIATLADQVVVLAETIGLFVMAGILPELMALHQSCIHQEVECIVNRGPAHLVAALFHLQEQGVYIEMRFMGVDFVEYGVAFRCFALTRALEICCEKFADFFLYLFDALSGCLIHTGKNP